jgi:hypothetical protein
MPIDPNKIDTLVGQLAYLTERLEHMELKARGDAVKPAQLGVADAAAGGYAPIEPHQDRFSPGGKAVNDAQGRKK